MLLIKKIRSQRGSTLVMVLMIFSILSLLGVTIMSIGTINFKIKLMDKKVKTALYLAEAGIDEAYAVILTTVKEAIEKGYEKVDAEYSEWYKIKEKDRPPATPEIWFQDGYKSHIETNLSHAINNNAYGILDSELANGSPAITVLSTKSFYMAPTDKFSIELESSFTYQKVTKKMKAKYEIHITSYKADQNELLKKTIIESLIKNIYIKPQ